MKTDKIDNLKSCVVPLSEIDRNPGPFCMSFGFDLDPLIQSIQRIGLINPPVLIEKKEGGLMIITGYKRILAHQEMALDKIGCRIMASDDLTPLECLRINLYDNLTVRKLNPVEKGMVLSRLHAWVAQDEILFQYMPLLGLPSHKQTLVLYLKIDPNLDDAIKGALAGGTLSMQSLKTLMDLDPVSTTAVCSLITNINFNINQQAQLVDDIIDISHIERKSIPDILVEDPLKRMISDPHMNNPQKAKAILNHLRCKRLPTVKKAEQIFKKKVSSLQVPKGVQITAPPNFEASRLTLTISFNNGVQLKDKIRYLNELKGLDDLNFPWKMK
ncbi:MAG: ParB/RepB/Spo0J family partition protein [Thermodesulfobacteriota bacterium]